MEFQRGELIGWNNGIPARGAYRLQMTARGSSDDSSNESSASALPLVVVMVELSLREVKQSIWIRAISARLILCSRSDSAASAWA